MTGPVWGGTLGGWVDNKVNGRATWDYVNTTFVKDIRLEHMQEVQVWKGPGYQDEPHYVITGVYNGNGDAMWILFSAVSYKKTLTVTG